MKLEQISNLVVAIVIVLTSLAFVLNISISKRMAKLEKANQTVFQHMSSQMEFDILVRNTMLSNGMWKIKE